MLVNYVAYDTVVGEIIQFGRTEDTHLMEVVGTYPYILIPDNIINFEIYMDVVSFIDKYRVNMATNSLQEK